MSTPQADPIAAPASVHALRAHASSPTLPERERRTPTSPSLQDLLHAHQEPGKPHYQETLEEYERCSGATVVDRYFSSGDEAAVLLSHPRRFRRPMYRIAVFHDAAATGPEFGELLRRIQLMERQAAVQLDGGAHQILVQSLFSLVVSLLSALAADRTTPDGKPRRVDAAVAAADSELTTLSRFVQSSARRSALGLYLAGLPVGAIIGSCSSRSPRTR